jgi:flagellar motor switch protein FliM
MTQTLRRSVEVHVLDNVEQRFGEFARHLPRPVSLHVIKMAPLPGRGMLAISGELIYTLIEIVFGGAGRKGRKAEPRDFTLIEQRVIANLTATIDRKYAEAWRPVYSVQIETGASEANPQFINIAQPSDKVVAVEYEVQIDDARAPMSICIPYSAIDPIKETLKGSTIGEEGSDGGAWGRELRRKLGEAKVEMRAMLGSATIAVQDLINLKVGDVIQLDEDFEHPIRLLIESAPKAWARVGAHKSARAVQVTGFIRDERKT